MGHKYLSGQIMEDHKDEKAEEKVVEIEQIEKIEALPNNPQKLQQLLRRKERLLLGMTDKYGLNKEEVKKILDLTDGRALALTPAQFADFYGSHPRELIDKFMEKSMNEKDKESMRSYLQNMADSYRRVQNEKLKMMDPSYHYGSLRSAVSAHHQAAIERIERAKKKYSEEYFKNVQ